MIQAIDNLHLFNEVADVPIPEALFLEVLLNCYFLAQPAAKKDLTVSAFANWLNDLYLVLGNEKGQLDTSAFEIL